MRQAHLVEHDLAGGVKLGLALQLASFFLAVVNNLADRLPRTQKRLKGPKSCDSRNSL